MKKKKLWLLYTVVCLLLVCGLTIPASAVTFPVQSFYGDLTADSVDVPAGAVIIAKVGVTEYGRVTTETLGEYGRGIDPKLVVQGPLEDGVTVDFYVTSTALGLDGVKANETPPFDDGELTDLDLTVGVAADTTAPTVTITALTPDPTKTNIPTFTGTATDIQSNITSVKYRVDGGSWSAATASDGAFDSLSEVYTFTTSAFPDGPHTVDVQATDAANNTTDEGDYASDSYTVDTAAPEVTIASIASDPTNISPIPMTATFSEAVTGFVVDDIAVTNGDVINFVAVSGTVYTFGVTPAAEGEVTVNIAAGVAQDAATNPNEAATQFSITYTTAVLAVTIDAVTTPTNVATQTLTGTRSEGLTVVLTSAEATFGAVSYDTTTWSAVVTLVEGSNGITATADTSTATATIVLDTTSPTVVSESPAAGATGVAVDTVVTATFGEDVTTVDLSGITISSGATGVSATLNEATDTITIAHDNFALLTSYTVTIPAGAVQDVAGNPLASAYSWSFITAMASLADLIAGTASGETLTLGAGTYTGDVIIDKSITITGTVGTIISGSIHILPLTGSEVTIENVTITEYTAYGIWIELVRADETFIIRNNTILGVEASVVGIQVDEVEVDGSLTIRENAISDNEVGIKLEADVADGSIWCNDITDNTIGLQQLAVGSAASASYNWWGDISGPEEENWNPGGIGNAVVGNILFQDYQPWLTRQFQTVLDDNIAYYGIAMLSLETGWNIISTPIALDPACDTWAEYVTLGDDLSIHPTSPAYAFDPTRTDDPWVPLTGDNADYRLEPCEAIYVRMAEPDVAAILYSPDVSVPSKQLHTGWNLVSLAWLPTSMEGIYGLPADEALVSVEEVTGGLTGYVLVVSPSVNPYEGSWIYTAGQSIEPWTDPEVLPPDGWMLISSGYWVFMLNEGTLAGFTFTPMSLD